jgi:hypothetical protein
MPRKRITPGAREGLIATIGIALYQPVSEAYWINVVSTGGRVIRKVLKPFTDFVNVVQWLQSAVLSCKEEEIISAYCARVELVIKRGPAYFETHSTQQVIEGSRKRRAPACLGE